VANRPGRPRLDPDDRAALRIALWVTPAQQRQWQRTAQAQHTSVSQLVRTAINAFVEDAGDPPVFPRTPLRRG